MAEDKAVAQTENDLVPPKISSHKAQLWLNPWVTPLLSHVKAI